MDILLILRLPDELLVRVPEEDENMPKRLILPLFPILIILLFVTDPELILKAIPSPAAVLRILFIFIMPVLLLVSDEAAPLMSTPYR